MAQVVNQFDTYDAANSMREDLAPWVDRITPDETPLYSMISDKTVKSTTHEWQTESLAAPSLDNAQVEGDEFNFAAVDPTTRVKNMTQIFRKAFTVSGTNEAVDHAGISSMVNHHKLMKGQEIKTDIEVTFLSNQASVAGDSATARRLGGLRAWTASNDSLGSGGSSGGYNSSTGVVDAATNGSQRALTLALIQDNLEATYKAGGSPTVLMLSPYAKRVFSSFARDSAAAVPNSQVRGKDQMTIYAAADMLRSDFGTIDVVPNRQMARLGASVARNAFLIQPDKLEKGWLRKIKEKKDVAVTADGVPTVLLCEVTLIVKNEAANGVIADLYGMSSNS